MPEGLILTFAELQFALRARPEHAAKVFEYLRINPESVNDTIAAAGIASLLARGLCTIEGDEVVPGREMVAVVAGLSTFHSHTEAAGWMSGRPVVLHLLSAPVV